MPHTTYQSRKKGVSVFVLTALTLAGCSYRSSYTHDRDESYFLDGDRLSVLVRRESGTAEHDLIGACPQDHYAPNRVGFFTLQFDLRHPNEHPAISPEIIVDSPATTRPSEIPPGVEPLWSPDRSGARRLPASLIPFDAAKFLELGVQPRRELVAADTPQGRCFLTFDFSKPGAQVVCPATRFVASTNVKVDYRALWDAAGKRLLLLRDRDGDFAGYTTQFVLWNYARGTTENIRLRSIDLSTVRPPERR